MTPNLAAGRLFGSFLIWNLESDNVGKSSVFSGKPIRPQQQRSALVTDPSDWLFPADQLLIDQICSLMLFRWQTPALSRHSSTPQSLLYFKFTLSFSPRPRGARARVTAAARSGLSGAGVQLPKSG